MSKYKRRADGRYCKQILVGYTPDGKRKMKNIYGKTIKEVEQKERELRDNIENGIDLTKQDITLKEWSLQWLNVYKNNVARATRAMYKSSLNNHIIPVLGDKPLSKLKPFHIQKAINEILDSGHTRTGEIFKLTIKQIISRAVQEELISNNICNNLEKIRSDTDEKRPLTDFEIRCITETKTYTTKERLFLKVLYYTGLRRGEALALTLHDVNMQQRKLSVNKSLDISENTPEIKTPKTKSGFREVPIPNELYEELKTYIKDHNSVYLFSTVKGSLPSRSSFRRMWESIIKKTQNTADEIARKEDSDSKIRLMRNTSIIFTPHLFRHTYATNLYYAGIDVKKSQYYLGHSSIEMTLKIYTHLDNERNEQDYYDRINNFFSQSKISQNEKSCGFAEKQKPLKRSV